MPIEFRCAQCGRLLRTPDDSAGRQAKCPECGHVQQVPVASGESPTASPAPAAAPSSPFGASQAGESPSPFGPPPPRDPNNPYSSPIDFDATPPLHAFEATALVPTQIGIEDVFRRTWEVFKQRWGFCLGTWVLLIVSNYLFAFLAQAVCTILTQAGGNRNLAELASSAVSLIAQVFSVWLTAGQIYTFVGLARGHQVSVGDIFAGGPYLLRFIGAGILYFLAVVGGLILLIVPGIIFGLMFSQCFYLIVDRNMGVLESLEKSREITYGNKGTLFLMGFCVAGLSLLALLTLCLGYLVLMPYLLVLYPMAYLMMSGQRTAEQVRYYAPSAPGFEEVS